MNQLNNWVQSLQVTQQGSVTSLVLVLLTAFIVGQMNAWFYMWTHRGVSYSRSFTHAIILICVVTAFSMSLIITNVVAALGLMGGMAIIRFRNVVRDTRDTVFVLLSLVCGMACGFGFFSAAIVGSAAVNLIALYLARTGFGSWHSVESLLRFQIEVAALDSDAFRGILHRFCRRLSLISVDEVPVIAPADTRMCQCAYKVRLRDPERAPELVTALKDAFKIDAIHLLVEQENEDVA